MRVNCGKKIKTFTAKNKIRQSNNSCCRGKLSIAGLGPGDRSFLSFKALQAIKSSGVIIGYKTYIKLLGDLVLGKEIFSSGMTQEIDRAKLAIEKAYKGKNVVLISSGDPGVYGMAGLVLELLDAKQRDNIEIEVIPAITAATGCASLLGAPLMHDFTVISLSDILTDIGLIKRRVALAVQGDFVIVFYNPQSKKRTRPLKEAWKILMKHRPGNTPVGIVRNAARPGEEVTITTLKDMLSVKIDMVTTIIVGNLSTYTKGKFMITPRGYGKGAI